MRTVDVIKELEQYDPGGENDLAFLVLDHGTGLARYALARCRDQELRAFAVELPRDLGPTKSGPRTRRGGEGY